MRNIDANDQMIRKYRHFGFFHSVGYFLCVLFQSIYFHTSIVSNNIVAVVELVASGLNQGGRLKKISCGWGIIRPFKDEELPDTTRGIKPPTQK